jgi:hypothetical protein
VLSAHLHVIACGFGGITSQRVPDRNKTKREKATTNTKYSDKKSDLQIAFEYLPSASHFLRYLFVIAVFLLVK